jgi:hypothetical protein
MQMTLVDFDFGHKPDGPTREELREFYRNANPRLHFPPFWFDASIREAIALGFERAAADLTPPLECKVVAVGGVQAAGGKGAAEDRRSCF